MVWPTITQICDLYCLIKKLLTIKAIPRGGGGGTGLSLCLYMTGYQMKQPPTKSNCQVAGGEVKCVLNFVTDKITNY